MDQRLMNEPGWFLKDGPAPNPKPERSPTVPKPKVDTNPVAAAYAAPNERIIEFSASRSTDGGAGLAGGLISILEQDDGSLVVDLGRLENTTVRVGGSDG